jgi:hypothetical protein
MESYKKNVLVSNFNNTELIILSINKINKYGIMKTIRTLLATVITLMFITGLLQAAVILDEPFDYTDGALIQVSNYQWTNHSGTLNQTDVSNGKVNLTQTESEDINRLLPNGPYTNITIFLSFTVNFTTLPGTGAYFLHLKDDGTMNFKARIFATTTGAASEKFRLGIAKGGNTFTTIPFDLSLNTEYKVVVRYDCTTSDSTIWINPVSADSTINRADAADTTSPVPIYAVALRQASGIGALTIDNLKIGDAFKDVAGSQSSTNPPSISAIADSKVPSNTSISPIPFTVLDSETEPDQLVVTVASDNQILIPDANITISGSGSDRTLIITSASNQQGTALITITVRDTDNNITTTSFYLTVGSPTISTIPNQIIQKNTSTPDLPFTVSDNETQPETITVSGLSSDNTIVASSGFVFGGSGSNRTVKITPVQDAVGIVTISIIASDGMNYATNSFKLTVAQSGMLELFEPFDYTDGALQENSSYRWFRHSGGTNETQVTDGKVLLNQTNTEDLSVYLYNISPLGYYPTNEGYILYSSFELNYKSLPTSSDYFAHYRDTGTMNFRSAYSQQQTGLRPDTTV